jgi:uncharacterized repeat protein (TIGR01451 family)
MSVRTAYLAVVAAVALGCGCSYNPSYFPYYIPGGRIVESHAKPGGMGYFRDFDPKAIRLEVTPNQQVVAPLGAQIVLVGSVLDKDGQPRRSRRIEWILDGPGNIVEADESGFYAGRGYKVDNKYAVTYTNYTTKTITRGNSDPADDVIIAPGQTFCVISSSVPGETVVTAYAPGVFNWENGRVVVRITWGEGRFTFPPPAVVRYGGEHTLTTQVTATGPDGVPSGYHVRYKVLEGPPVMLVSRSGSGTGASQSGTTGREAEAFTDANGQAAVRLVQLDPKPGKTRVAIEIVKPPETGTGPGTVVARRETIVEWAEPKLNLVVNTPATAGVGTTFPVTVALDNAGVVESKDALLTVALSDGALLASSDPPPNRQEPNGKLVFNLPPLAGNSRQDVKLQVKSPPRPAAVTVTAEATTAGGLRATNTGTTRVEPGKLQVLVEAPAAALAGERIPVKIAVTNTGAGPAENVIVWARFDPGLLHPSPDNPVELVAGTLAPGQTKTLDLPLTASATGRYSVRATATGDGNLTASAEPATIEVRKAQLSLSATGPKLAYLNEQFTWTLTLSNTGEATVSNIVVRATIPPEVGVKTADGGKAGAGSIEWKLSELRPGEQKAYSLKAVAARLVDRAVLTVVALGDATSGGRTMGDPVEARGEAATAIIGTPAVVLEVATPPGVVEVGKRVAYTVRVKNQGTLSARNIEVTTFAPPELRVVRGTGPTDGRIDATGKVTFPAVDELRPGQTLTFTIEAEALQPGDARFRAEVKAAHLTNTLKEEQATRVMAR